MKVLVTGSSGFIGKHMCLALERAGHIVLSFDKRNTEEELVNHIKECEYIIHLAGINRPLTSKEFFDGNTNFTIRLVELVKQYNPNVPFIMSSSIQAELDNDYGKSKKMAEDYLFDSGLPVYIYRLKNVFGKWCKPNYNSVCATFCYNTAHDIPVSIRDTDYIVHFNYIDDICDAFLSHISKDERTGSKDILYISKSYDCSLGNLAALLASYKAIVESDLHLPFLHSEFELKLFITFLDYLKDDKFKYNHASDERGSFTELYKNNKYGQISINMIYPGVTKGGHYHTYKDEMFYTVIGKSLIRQRNIKTNEMIVNEVSGKNPQRVKLIPYYTHDIKNIGESISYTLMWISEIYSDKTPDTYKEEV